MKVNLDSIPSNIIALLQKNLGTGYLHRKVYLDTVEKRTICIGPSYVYVFEGLQCEEAEETMYGIPYDVFRLGLEEGIMEVSLHKIRIGSTTIATEPTVVGEGSKEQVAATVGNMQRDAIDLSWQELDITTLSSLRDSRKFMDMKSERSYVYLNRDLVTVVGGGDFFALFEVNTPFQLALSAKASEILVSNLSDLEIAINKHFIHFRCDGFIGSTSNYTHGSHRFEDLPSRELIEAKLGNVAEGIFFDSNVKAKFKKLLTLLSDHLKNHNLVIRLKTSGLMIVDKRLEKTLGIIDGISWDIDGVWEIGLPNFLKLYSLMEAFTIRAPSTKGVGLGSFTSGNKTVLLAMENIDE